jgi:hypothetical protein
MKLSTVTLNGSTALTVAGNAAGFIMPAGNAAVTATFVSADEVVFEWNSVDGPMADISAASGAVASGYPGVDFRVNGTYGDGYIRTTDGAFNLTNNFRLVIGATTGSNTNSTTHVPGVFNLSSGRFRLTLDYLGGSLFKESTNYVLRVLVNNNQTGQAESVINNNRSVFRAFTELNHFTTGTAGGNGLSVTQVNDAANNRVTLTFTPTVSFADVQQTGKDSLATAFFTLISQNTSTITMTGIKREKVVE